MKIMFVCHGNICRSPMAEFIFRDMLSGSGTHGVFAASSATSGEEIFHGIGNPIYPPAARELRLHGVAYEQRQATRLLASDAGEYDMFIGMDSANIVNMKRILGEGAFGRIYRLMDFSARGGDVADPWYSGRFDIAFRDIYEGCLGLFEYIRESLMAKEENKDEDSGN